MSLVVSGSERWRRLCNWMWERGYSCEDAGGYIDVDSCGLRWAAWWSRGRVKREGPGFRTGQWT